MLSVSAPNSTQFQQELANNLPLGSSENPWLKHPVWAAVSLVGNKIFLRSLKELFPETAEDNLSAERVLQFCYQDTKC